MDYEVYEDECYACNKLDSQCECEKCSECSSILEVKEVKRKWFIFRVVKARCHECYSNVTMVGF